MNEAYVEFVHWRDTYLVKEFIIMWSDHTWESVQCPFDRYYIGDKTYKQFMDLNKMSTGKMTRDKAMNHIQTRFKEYEEKWA